LAVIAQVDVWAGAPLNLGHLVGPAPVVSLLYVVTSLALVWRRGAPLAVLAFIVSLDTVVYLTYGAPEGLGSLLPTVVALYAVGRWARPGAVAVAAPLAALGVVVHELTDPIYVGSGANAVFYAVVAAAWPLGNAFRRRAAQAADLRQHALDLTVRGDAVAREAVDAERARIARELHDIVGHGLSLIVLQQVGASAALEKAMVPEAMTLLGNSERVARDTLTEMRRLLGLLSEDSPVGADLQPPPGLHDLEKLTRDAELAGAVVRTQVTGIPVPLSAGLDLTSYRILQECLTNVLKHSQPPECEVHITYEPDHVVLAVSDHGRAVPADLPGRGLAGMAERVSIYHGTLSYGPAPGGGFAVTARLPMRP
jgi:signal transduction histidine kinase